MYFQAVKNCLGKKTKLKTDTEFVEKTYLKKQM